MLRVTDLLRHRVQQCAAVFMVCSDCLQRHERDTRTVHRHIVLHGGPIVAIVRKELQVAAAAAEPMPDEVRVAYRGRQTTIQLSDSLVTLKQLSEAVTAEFQVVLSAQKLLVGGKVLRPVESPDLAVSEAGMTLCRFCRSSLVLVHALSLPSCTDRELQALQEMYLMLDVKADMLSGIRAGDKILLLSQPGKDELARLDVPDQRIRGFDEELSNAALRRQSRPFSSPPRGKSSLDTPVKALHTVTTSPLLRCN